jgi:hypothetical protein
MSYPPRPPGMNLTPGQMPVPQYMTGYIQNSKTLLYFAVFLLDITLIFLLLTGHMMPAGMPPVSIDIT